MTIVEPSGDDNFSKPILYLASPKALTIRSKFRSSKLASGITEDSGTFFPNPTNHFLLSFFFDLLFFDYEPLV